MSEILHKDLLGEDIHELKVTLTSAPPSTIPKFVGQGLYDIVNKKFYVAQGTALITDWVTTPIPPFLQFNDTRTIVWTSSQVGTQLSYEAQVSEADLILTASNVTDFSQAVLDMPEIISLMADQHTRLIMRTGSEAGGWSPVILNGLEVDEQAQKIRLTQNLSAIGNPTFNEVTLTIKATTPILTITQSTDSAPASIFFNETEGLIVRGAEGSNSALKLQNEQGDDVLVNPVGTNHLVAPSLVAPSAPGIVHADSTGLLTTSKIVDADVNADAAIAGTKIVPDFGNQDIQTTGSLLIDTIDSQNNELSVLANNNNNTVNMGTGTGYNTINIGGPNSVVNIQGGIYSTPVEYVSSDKTIILNFGSSGLSGQDSGIEIQEEHSEVINISQVEWQSGNTVRLYTTDTSDPVIGDYLRVSGFSNESNNGTFKIADISVNAYFDVLNQNRTDATDDETSAATASHLVINGYVKVGPSRESWDLKSPAHLGIISFRQQNSENLTITSTGTSDVTVDFKTDLVVDQDLQKSASVEFANLNISSLTTGIAHVGATGDITSSLIQNVDVDGAAAIAGTKISPDFGLQNVSTQGDGTFKSLKVTGAEQAGGSTISSSATNGIVLRGHAGTSSQFKFVSETGTSLLTLSDTGVTTLYNLTTTGVVKASSGGVLSSSLLVDADVDAAAAISGDKIVSASLLASGVVSTGAQSFAGAKTFGSDVTISTLNQNGIVHTNTDGLLSTSLLKNADVASDANIDATKIANQPSGKISSISVQDAIDELDDEKVSRDGDSLTGSLTFAHNTGIESETASSTLNIGTSVNTSTLNLGTGSSVSAINIGTGTAPTVINIGSTGDTVNITGNLNSVNVTDMEVSDKNITINKNGAVATADGAGLNVEEDSVITAYAKVSNSRGSWEFKAPAKDGSVIITPSVDSYFAELLIPTLATNAVYTFPTSTDVLVGRDSADTLTNKTLLSPLVDEIVPNNVDGTIEIVSTAALKVPTGTSDERFLFTSENGMVRYNTFLNLFEGHTDGQWAPLAGNATTDQITQAIHGFSVGEAVRLNGSVYEKAIATASNTAQVVGVVSQVIDVNNFEIALSGEITNNGWSLVPGGTYYLSSTTSGEITLTEPDVVGQVNVQVGVARTTTSLYVDIKRGKVVGETNARTTLQVYNNASTNIVDISGYTALKLEGELNINRTSTNQRAQYTVEAVQTGAGTWEVQYQYVGDEILYTTLPSWSVVGSHLVLTLPQITDFVDASLTYSLNAPSIGASLTINSNIVYTNYKSVSSAYTIDSLDSFVSARGSSPFAVTLPSAIGLTGKTFIIKNSMNAGVLLTVNTTSSQTIDGSLSVVLSRYSSLHVISNGAGWEIF